MQLAPQVILHRPATEELDLRGPTTPLRDIEQHRPVVRHPYRTVGEHLKLLVARQLIERLVLLQHLLGHLHRLPTLDQPFRLIQGPQEGLQQPLIALVVIAEVRDATHLHRLDDGADREAGKGAVHQLRLEVAHPRRLGRAGRDVQPKRWCATHAVMPHTLLPIEGTVERETDQLARLGTACGTDLAQLLNLIQLQEETSATR